MELVNPDYNPMPQDPVAGRVETSDGMSLRYARWLTTRPPCKGTVLLLNGRAEYIEKLYETISDLRGQGFDVLTFDWRGQGGSSRLVSDPRRGFIDHFDQYLEDLDTIMEKVALPDCRAPFFVLAHSTGALVAMLAAPAYVNRIQRMVLCSPLFEMMPHLISQNFIKWMAGTMHVLGLGSLYMAGGPTPDKDRAFAGNKLTSDSRRFKRNTDFAGEFRHLTIGGPTASWVFASCRAMDKINDPDFEASVSIPILMICAGNDTVVNNRKAEMLGARLRSGSCLIIPGARHELLQERDIFREQMLAAFNAFVPGSMSERQSGSRDTAEAGR